MAYETIPISLGRIVSSPIYPNQGFFHCSVGAGANQPRFEKYYIPEIERIDTKNDGFGKMYLLSNMVILGIHVSFRGCTPLEFTNISGWKI